MDDDEADRPGGPRAGGLSRGRFLAAAAGGAAGLVAGPAPSHGARRRPARTVAFHGARQPGIATTIQRHATFLAFALDDGLDVDGLGRLLRATSATAEALMAGRRPPRTAGAPRGASADSGVAIGLDPARLTVTLGLGPAPFDRLPALARLRPPGLAPLPSFAGDDLDPARTGGDLLLQVCADDAQVVSHAARHLVARLAGTGAGRLAWSQAGFVSRPPGGGAPRNLLGQPDGTTNPRRGSRAFAAATTVRRGDGPDWAAGGSFCVVRRIRMDLPAWDAVPLRAQERALGRRRDDGQPLSPVARDAHIRLAHGARMHRRSYNYDDGLDAGLLFCAYLRDPGRHFVPVQQRLAAHDALRRFVTATGGGLFFVPRGVRPGGYVGDELVAAAGGAV